MVGDIDYCVTLRRDYWGCGCLRIYRLAERTVLQMSVPSLPFYLIFFFLSTIIDLCSKYNEGVGILQSKSARMLGKITLRTHFGPPQKNVRKTINYICTLY